MISLPSQVGLDRVTPAAFLVTATTPVPSGCAVAMLPSASTKAIRLPSWENAASVTVVGKFTAASPIITVFVPLDTNSAPAL